MIEMWKEEVKRWIKQFFGENEKCAICEEHMHNSSIFPDDFPKDWRWCCSCLAIGKMLVERDIEETEYDFYDSPTTLIRIENVDKMINVV